MVRHLRGPCACFSSAGATILLCLTVCVGSLAFSVFIQGFQKRYRTHCVDVWFHKT
jgi:hypothetical protein